MLIFAHPVPGNPLFVGTLYPILVNHLGNGGAYTGTPSNTLDVLVERANRSSPEQTPALVREIEYNSHPRLLRSVLNAASCVTSDTTPLLISAGGVLYQPVSTRYEASNLYYAQRNQGLQNPLGALPPAYEEPWVKNPNEGALFLRVTPEHMLPVAPALDPAILQAIRTLLEHSLGTSEDTAFQRMGLLDMILKLQQTLPKKAP